MRRVDQLTQEWEALKYPESWTRPQTVEFIEELLDEIQRHRDYIKYECVRNEGGTSQAQGA